MARFSFSDQQYGQAEVKTTVADKLVVQASLPRFLAYGDVAVVAVDLHNLSGADMHLQGELVSSGNFLDNRFPIDIELEDKQKTTILQPIATNVSQLSSDANQLSIQLQDQKSGYQRQLQWQLAMRPKQARETRQQSFKIDPSFTPSLDMQDVLTESAEFQLTISDRPLINYQQHFTQLLKYPYGCLEQTTSRGYPWLFIDANELAALGLTAQFEQQFKQPFNKAFKLEQIQKAVEKILPRQKSHGGFGLWSQSSSEAYWPTVYATEFLMAAQAEGAVIAQDSIEKAIDRLQTYVNGNVNFNYYYGKKSLAEFSTRAYAAFVLAQQNRLNLSHLQRLHKVMKAEKQPLSALTYYYMAASFISLGDQIKAQQLLQTAAKQPLLRGKRYWQDYGSAIRDLAIMERLNPLFAGLNVASQLEQLTQWVNGARYLSTQERLQLLRLVTQSSDGQAYEFDIVTEQNTQTIQEERRFNTLFDFEQYLSIAKLESSQTLYGQLVMSADLSIPRADYQKDIELERQFFNVDGEAIDMKTVKAGELVLVQVSLNMAKTSPYAHIADALLVELIPAGFELENPALTSAIEVSRLSIAEKKISDFAAARLLHQEYRDDRFVAALQIDKEQRHVFYVMRAAFAGEYALPASYVEDMYRPTIYALKNADVSTVTIE